MPRVAGAGNESDGGLYGEVLDQYWTGTDRYSG